MSIVQRLRCAIAEREIIYKIASGEIIFKMMLIMIEYLQKLNEIRKKRLLEAHERTEIHILVKKIRLCDQIDSLYFYDMYELFVESKRRKMLEDINALEDERNESWLRRHRGEAPGETYPVEKRIKEIVLKTYYEFLKHDNTYMQKAFLEFLKKKVEEGDGRQEISAYLERIYQCEKYDENLDCLGIPISLSIPELWIEFFRSGTGYADLIPDERPNVAYRLGTQREIPRFIFEKPFVGEFTEQEFADKFTKEWCTTFDYPDDTYAYDDYDVYYDRKIYRQECDMELAVALEETYQEYRMAVMYAEQIRSWLGQPIAQSNKP